MSNVFNLYGIRSYVAKKNIAQMSKDDMALWYSSSAGRMIYGTMQVKDTCFNDKTSSNNWLAIDLVPVTTFAHSVSYSEFKTDVVLMNSNIINQKRITVIKITSEEYDKVLKLSQQ